MGLLFSTSLGLLREWVESNMGLDMIPEIISQTKNRKWENLIENILRRQTKMEIRNKF